MALKDLLQNVGNKLVSKEFNEVGADKNKKSDKTPIKKFFDENSKEVFFPPTKIDTERAARVYPYRLLVIDVKNGNKIVKGDTAEDFYTEYSSDTGGFSFGELSTNKWEFILPITPQQLSITDQFAINTTATMRGVVEEHNGVKFKIIQASGTTGIWPNRNTFEDPTAGQGQSLFGGTLEALGGLVDAAQSLENTINNKKTKPKSLNDAAKKSQSTGYYQALLLQQFLEQYAIAKKNPKNKHWRLVFDYPKNNESFVVTPMQYTVTKSQRSPGEHLFNMQFKAWKRIDLKKPPGKEYGNKIQELDPTFFQTLTSSLDSARGLMSASLNVIKAVRADFRKPFDTLRKVTLLMKDFGGIGLALSDLPNQIARDITSATEKRVSDLALIGIGSSLGSKTRKSIKDIKKESDNNEGQSSDETSDGENGTQARDAKKSSPVNNIFNEPEANFELFNLINISDLQLTPQQIIAIEDEIELNSLISIEEIKESVVEIQNLILDLTNNFGSGDSFFSKIYGRPEPKQRAIPMTVEEFELVKTLEEAVLNMNLLVATRDFDDIRIQSPLEYVGGLAEESGIDFSISSPSKYLAPVPFGLTMEEISARYLDDPDRYNEIITLNNLRSPYIDEEGFFYNLLSNGDGRQFNINSKQNLFIGQKIQISSNTVPMFTRKITAIEKITDTNYLITVDGISNLDVLKIQDNAKIKAFLPGTVNSQNQIFIPSEEIVDQTSRTYDIPFLQEDTLTSISKIDWLLDDSGDIVLNSFGEANLANGLTNIVQALKMKISTEKGQILSDPSFGVGVNPGVNVSEIQLESILKDMRGMVLSDSRFSDVKNIEITVLPPTLSIKINAVLANGNGIFPINFTV